MPLKTIEAVGRYKLRNRLNKLGIVFILILSTFTFNSCYKFSGDQTIPSYIKIDSIGLSTYYFNEGSDSHNITDAWVYVDDNLIGVFELPALVPILKSGPQNIDVRAGIKLNGISSTRVPYPFYNAISFDGYELYPDSVRNMGYIKTTYQSNLVFAWMEDFEDSGLTFEEISISDTAIKRTVANDPNAYQDEYSQYSGIVNLTQDKPVWSATSLSSYPITKQGSAVLLEMDFKTNNYFNVGLLIKEYSQFIKIPLVILNHAETWRKIYINLGPNITLHPQADYFKVVIESEIEDENTQANIYMDNIKLIYFQQ